MYIGPWQEYNLSKERKNQTNNLNSNVRKGIEDVLLQTLDPNAARTALQAMEQYFQHQQQQPTGRGGAAGGVKTNNETPRSTQSENINFTPDFQPVDWQDPNKPSHPMRPNIPKATRNNNRSLQNRIRVQLPPLETTLILDPNEVKFIPFQNNKGPANTLTVAPIARVAQSANRNGNKNGSSQSPLSVRSSQSEPIQPSNRLPKLNHVTKDVPSSSSVPTPTTGTTTSTRTSYDSNALVNFLKMERNEKAKYEIIKLTGWERSVKRSQGAAAGSGGGGTVKLQPLSNDQKLQQIRHMKDLYMTQNHQQQQQQRQIPLENSGKMLLDPLPFQSTIEEKGESKSMTIREDPIVTDLQITEQELLKVSKYFESMNLSHLISSSFELSQSNPSEKTLQAKPPPSHNSPSKQLSPRRLKTVQTFSDEDDDNIPPSQIEAQQSVRIEHFKTDQQSNILSPGLTGKNKNSPLPYSDEYYTGGVDGLLSWTKQLNLDEVES